MANAKSKDEEAEQFALLAKAAAALVAVALLPMLALAAGMFWLARNRLRRWQFGLVSLAGLLMALLGGAQMVADYINWILSIFGAGPTTFWHIPWLMLLSVSLLLAGIVGMVGSHVLGSIHPTLAEKLGETAPADGANLLPADRVRSGMKIAAFDDSGLSRTAAESHASKRRRNRAAADEPASIALGVDPNHQTVKLFLPDLRTHAMVLGSTGSGKTEMLKRMIGALLDQGWSGCVLDLKEDVGPGGLEHFAEAWARANGVPYQSWALSYTAEQYDYYYNPLAGMPRDMARNVIISTQDFEAPHWAALAKMVLGQLLTLLYDAHELFPDRFPEPELYRVGKILGSNFAAETKEMRAMVLAALEPEGKRSKDDYSILANPTQDQRNAAVGMSARITQMYESEVGRTGLAVGGRRRPLQVESPGLVYIGLDSLGQLDTSKILAASVMARYAALAAERKHDPNAVNQKRFLVIDEANVADQQMLINLLSRGRSSHITLIIATQGAKDFEDNLPAILQNTNVTVVMRQQDPESATLSAEMLGTVEVSQSSEQMRDGVLVGETVRTSEEFRVPPEQLRALHPGEGFLRVSDRYGSAQPYITFMYVRMREIEHPSSRSVGAVDRYKDRNSQEFLNHIPSFDED